jgi:hypothetical protein
VWRAISPSSADVSALILSPGFISSTVLEDRGLRLYAIGILLNWWLFVRRNGQKYNFWISRKSYTNKSYTFS